MLKRFLLVCFILCLGGATMAQTAAPSEPLKEARMAADVENIEYLKLKAALAKFDPQGEQVLNKAYMTNLKAIPSSKNPMDLANQITARMRTFNETTKELVILAQTVVSKNKTGITKPTSVTELAYSKLMNDIAAGTFNLGDPKQSKKVIEQISKLKSAKS